MQFITESTENDKRQEKYATQRKFVSKSLKQVKSMKMHQILEAIVNRNQWWEIF